MGPNESKVQIHSAIYTTRLSWEFPNVWGLWCAYHPNQKASLRNLQNTSVTFIKGLITELVWFFFPHATFFLVMWCTEICVKFNLQSSFHARHSTIQRLHGHRPGIKMMRWKLKKCEQKWYKQFSVVTQYFLYPQNFMKWNWDRQTVRNRGNNQISIPAASAAFSPPSFLRGPGGEHTLEKKLTKKRTLTSLRGRTSEKKPLWWSKWLVFVFVWMILLETWTLEGWRRYFSKLIYCTIQSIHHAHQRVLPWIATVQHRLGKHLCNHRCLWCLDVYTLED